jgi:hypothetical protein
MFFIKIAKNIFNMQISCHNPNPQKPCHKTQLQNCTCPGHFQPNLAIPRCVGLGAAFPNKPGNGVLCGL